MQSLYKQVSILAIAIIPTIVVQVEALDLRAANENNNKHIDIRDAQIECNSNQFDRNDYVAQWSVMDNWLLNGGSDYQTMYANTKQIYESGTAQIYICNNYAGGRGTGQLQVYEDKWNQFMQVLDNQCGQTNGGWARSRISGDVTYGRDISNLPECGF